MSIKAVGLTDAEIRNLVPSTANRIELPDQIVPGLRIRVGQSGAKTFILRKRVGGHWKNITIGPFKDYFGLADASKKARSILLDIDNGRGAAPDTSLMVECGLGYPAVIPRSAFKHAPWNGLPRGPASIRIRSVSSSGSAEPRSGV